MHAPNHRLRALSAASALAVLLLAMRATACSSGPEARASDASPANEDARAPDADAPTDSAREDDGAWPDPSGVPEGWKRVDKLPRSCGIYGPSAPQYLTGAAKGIAWAPCPEGLAPSGLVCSRIVTDWSSNKYLDLLSSAAGAAPDQNGTMFLQLIKFVDDFSYAMIVNAETGEAKNAFLNTDPANCGLASGSIGAGRYALRMLAPGLGQAFVGGPIGTIPPSTVIPFSSGSHGPSVTPFGIVDLTENWSLDLYGWDGMLVRRLWSAMNDGLQHGDLVASSSAVFWNASTSALSRVQIFAGTSAGDFLTVGSDTSRGHGDLGTDGKDLVWIYASGRPSSNGPYPTLDIMTAPYAENTASVAARRLRSEEGSTFGTAPFHVGCGFAARFGDKIRLVRLSDGRSWLFPAATGSLHWSRPLAVTCDEVFLLAAITGTNVMTVARVRIDSLGPGIDPD